MNAELSAVQARRHRWRVQLLGGSDLEPADVVRRAVALQGQDLPAVLAAIALRSRPGTTIADVRAAFDAGALVRSWPLRGTLFATTPDRLAALLHFTAERIHRAAARRRAQLGLDDQVIERAREVIREALAAGPLRRAEALGHWEAAGIATDAGRGYHLLMHLAVDGLLHWGPFTETATEQLLTLSTAAPPEDPDAALADAVRGYVLARGPVTESDLAWWTKQPLTLLRRALGAAEDLVQVSMAGTPAWIAEESLGSDERAGRSGPTVSSAETGPTGVTLVPGFDEWILGYADRSLVASPAMLRALVPGGNGVFRPAVLVDGVVVGTWRRPRRSAGSSPAATAPIVELVEPVSASTRREIERAIERWIERGIERGIEGAAAR